MVKIKKAYHRLGTEIFSPSLRAKTAGRSAMSLDRERCARTRATFCRRRFILFIGLPRNIFRRCLISVGGNFHRKQNLRLGDERLSFPPALC